MDTADIHTKLLTDILRLIVSMHNQAYFVNTRTWYVSRCCRSKATRNCEMATSDFSTLPQLMYCGIEYKYCVLTPAHLEARITGVHVWYHSAAIQDCEMVAFQQLGWTFPFTGRGAG